MEQQSSTSTVTVEYFDPHDVYKLLAPGLVPRLPLHNLHWQSHSGPLRSIDTLHVELVQGGDVFQSVATAPTPHQSSDNVLLTPHVGASSEAAESTTSLSSRAPGGQRRHQIPGIRRTPYLKLLLVRCDDNDSYKSSVRAEIREWVKAHTSPTGGSSKKSSSQENHDAFEWLIVHVVIPNTVAATQPRTNNKSDSVVIDKATTSRWRSGSTPLMEKLRTDFNGSAKGSQDRIAQIRIGINDVPYSLIPRVVPAVPSGYSENEQDAEHAWSELVSKFKSLILSSFDMRVTQYEEDIREKDAQRSLPGWNFCTFFMLKEGLARGFENVGLVEDALVGYDELNVGLDAVIHEQFATGSPEAHGGAMLSYSEDLKLAIEACLAKEEKTVDVQSIETVNESHSVEIAISSTKKAYREMIMENKVSVFDFRCYIFSRQIALLLRLGNAVSSREELLAKLRRQQDSILTGEAPLAPPPPSQKDEPENLAVFAEICERTLQFIPSVSQNLRRDLVSALLSSKEASLSAVMEDAVENMVASFAFSVAQQILAQTSTKALPIPPSALSSGNGQEPKALIPEPKTMLHPARSSSLFVGRSAARPPPSPGVFPGPGRQMPPQPDAQSHFVKPGLEDLAARRAELYMVSRTILTSLGKKRGWSNGWDEASAMAGHEVGELEDVNLDDDNHDGGDDEKRKKTHSPSISGIDIQILRTATGSVEDFYRLYEILTDKAMRHYTVASHDHAVHSSIADLAVLKIHVKDYKTAASYFCLAAPFFGESGWTLLELSMLAMYAQCLDEMQSEGEYMSVALKLLTRSCAVERHRLKERTGRWREKGQEATDAPSLKGVIEKLCRLARTLSSEVKIPLASFFSDVELAGPPEYQEKQDGCWLVVKMRSLLPGPMQFDSVKLKLVSVDGGSGKERVFEKTSEEAITIVPGRNEVKLECNSVVGGRYKIDHLGLSSSHLLLQHKGDGNASTTRTGDIFKESNVMLVQRKSAFDVTLEASKDTSLDKNNTLELGISTGWNDVKSCEVRVKPATGGVRFSTNRAVLLNPDMEMARAPEGGVFYFGPMAAGTSVKLRFPYSMEQEVTDVFAKVEARYVTEGGTRFSTGKAVTVPVSLALGVNVQDVFKHQALWSRFNVSTAGSSPLRLLDSELVGSELFESAFGAAPSSKRITIFPRQPASLLYRIERKKAAVVAGKTTSGRTMYLKLRYTVVEKEVEEHIRRSLASGLEGTGLEEYTRLVAGAVLGEARNRMQGRDLERAALTGEMTTRQLAEVRWENHFDGVGQASKQLSEYVREWVKSNTKMELGEGEEHDDGSSQASSIVIPVEIPSVSVVHTADIRLHLAATGREEPRVWTNQVVGATLHIKWTRRWRTEWAHTGSQEFIYEVSGAGDAWLVGGRRRGHFTIPPGKEDDEDHQEGEMEVALVLVAQREGWVPYPAVEIRETGGEAQGSEVDVRNLGETVRVVGNRRGITVSLDASGPGGGPLVFDSEELESCIGLGAT